MGDAHLLMAPPRALLPTEAAARPSSSVAERQGNRSISVWFPAGQFDRERVRRADGGQKVSTRWAIYRGEGCSFCEFRIQS
jgi:hypothetical protein